MDKETIIFEKLKAELLNGLLPLGFTIIGEKSYPEVFGSRDILLQKGKQAVNLVWDGKESWFVLQSCSNIETQPFPDWQELAFKKFDSRVETDFRDDQFLTAIKTFCQK